ncbi:NAD-dependent epimerase/dehydratase family protein [Thauera sp. 2A1]|uniref:NAD-dependent epimerase/dehydratase family protein n=1 Tax=Thauera sp. 2A1 TaxID=2570191 RepID=UPI001884DBC6|nr:NAD-dependent epimerase/dehydratase family protein [Thauera sp. 2A1]KAI5914816.1 NAD-dependent epimerase/dehydratase family protein [Thauera sp. 2A1]
MKLIVAGGSGYIGRALVKRAAAEGHDVLVLTRRRDDELARYAAQSGYDGPLPATYVDADALINLAGRAHVHGRSTDSDFDAANCQLPLMLASHVIENGIGRLVHVSSVGVYGNWSAEPITEYSRPSPDTAYTRSKLAADQALEDRFRSRPDALTIVRPPMVYGPACPGNFMRLRRLVRRGFPLPFGAARAKRSFIFVENLADFLLRCATPGRPGGMYVIGDGSDYSVSHLVSEMAVDDEKRIANISVSPWLLRFFGRACGFQREMESLTLPLKVDWAHARKSLGWEPPVAPSEAMRTSLVDYG